MNLVFDPDAIQEAGDAAAYYEACRVGLGVAFHAALKDAVTQIRLHPLLWRCIGKRFRRCLLKSFPYAIIYAIFEDTVYIVAVMHLHRKPGYWRRRLKGAKPG